MELDKKMLNSTTGEVDNKKVMALLKGGRVNNDKEAKIITDVYDRFVKMKEWRQTSCPWKVEGTAGVYTEPDRETPTQYETEKSSTAGDWEWRWKMDRDLAMMKSGHNKYDSDLPPVSVPLVWSSKQTIINQYQDSNISIIIEPKAGSSKVDAKIAEAYLQDLEENFGVKNIKQNLLFPEAVVCGTAISYNGYVTKKRTVKMIKTADQLIEEYGLNVSKDSEEYTQIIEKLKKNPELTTEEKEIVDYDNPVCEFVPLEEMYVDPGAWDFNSVTRDARDCIWRQYVPIQQVLSDYQNADDPFIIQNNLTADLITSSGGVTQFYADNTLNDELSDLLNIQGFEDKVCLIKYYNKYQDQYIVIANDIVIRSGPLPYNHKKLPFSKYIFLPLPRNFYGVGLGTLLDTTQRASEMFESLESYLTELNNNQPLVAKGQKVYEELEQIMGSSKYLKAGTVIQGDIGDEVMPIVAKLQNFDFDKIQARLKENAIQTTFINPTLATNPRADLAVRSAQMGQESGLLAIRSYIQNFEQGYVDCASQILSIAKQFEPARYTYFEDSIENIMIGTQTKNQIKKLKLANISFKDDEMSDSSMQEDANGTEIDLTQDMLEKFEDTNIKVRVESTQLASRQLQAQQMTDLLTSVVAVRSNPAVKEDKITNAVLKLILDKSNMPPQVLSLMQNDENEESTKLAMLQNDQMLKGISVTSIAGEDEKHKQIHSDLIVDLINQVREVDKQIEQLAPTAQQVSDLVGQGVLDPAMGQQIYSQGQSLVTKKEELNKTIDLLQQHLVGDIQQKDQSDIATVTMAQGLLQPPMPTGQPMMTQDPMQQPMQPETPMNPMSGI
jgi:hypothetical protein